jgi:AraC-like DNA-binding protein
LVTGSQLADRAFLSRFRYQRLVVAALGESPVAFTRRLLLERAACQLGRGASVTDAGLEAGYGSSVAFGRAFARAFGAAPSRYEGGFRLAAPNGVHFHPPGGLIVPASDERSEIMDLTDRMLERDL